MFFTGKTLFMDTSTSQFSVRPRKDMFLMAMLTAKFLSVSVSDDKICVFLRPWLIHKLHLQTWVADWHIKWAVEQEKEGIFVEYHRHLHELNAFNYLFKMSASPEFADRFLIRSRMTMIESLACALYG